MNVTRSIPEQRAARARLTGRVGAVFTMGALHAGHAALVSAARAENDSVVATIFVNPTQFAASEDLARYPRPLEADLALLEGMGAHLVFCPTPEQMYPAGFQTTVHIDRASQGLEGARRPGHFDGVATVVAKLFNLTLPDRAYFGQKDAQQVAVIRALARDLDFPLEVIVCPTAREPDGLALSSRNRYLSADDRASAPAIYAGLLDSARAWEAGERGASGLIDRVERAVVQSGRGQIAYVSLNDARTLAPTGDRVDGPALLSAAVTYGETTLLDDVLLPLSLNTRDGLTGVLGALQFPD